MSPLTIRYILPTLVFSMASGALAADGAPTEATNTAATWSEPPAAEPAPTAVPVTPPAPVEAAPAPQPPEAQVAPKATTEKPRRRADRSRRRREEEQSEGYYDGYDAGYDDGYDEGYDKRDQEAVTPSAWREKVLGVKTQVVQPYAAGMDFATLSSFGFDARLERDTWFFEWGAGFTFPYSYNHDTMEGYGGVYAELGASFYLTRDDLAPYVGFGVMPRIFGTGDGNGVGGGYPVYGQLGMMMMRSESTRLYLDLRVAQNTVGFDCTTTETTDGQPETQYVRPTEVAIEFGVGW